MKPVKNMRHVTRDRRSGMTAAGLIVCLAAKFGFDLDVEVVAVILAFLFGHQVSDYDHKNGGRSCRESNPS